MGSNLLSSLDFTSSPPWWFFTGTMTTGRTDADGGTKAVKMTPDTSTANHSMFQDVGSLPNVARRAVFEIVAKPAGYNWFWLYLSDGGSNYRGTGYDMGAGAPSGTNGNGTATFLDSSMNPIGGGWFLCRLFVSLPASTTCSVLIRSADSSGVDFMAGDGTSGVDFFAPSVSEATSTPWARPFNPNLLR